MDVHKEVHSSLAHFAKFFNLEISPKQLVKFYEADHKRKSLSKIGTDCILLISEFLPPFDQLSLISICKELYKHIDTIRLRIVSWQYPTNILPKDPVLQWKQLCMDWLMFERDRNYELNTDFKNITTAETPLRYCQQELKKLSIGSYDPLPQTIIAINTYKCQIICETRELNKVWNDASYDSVSYYALYSWMILDTGLLIDLPEIDERLYGGMSKEDLLKQMDGYESDDSRGRR